MQALIICLTTLLLVACGGQEKLDALPAGATVLILGDSLSYGTGAKEGEDYPARLAQSTGWEIVNAGVPGDTSEQGLARLPDLLSAHEPKVLMVALGGNDFLTKAAASVTIANLKRIIEQGKVAGATVVLIAIPNFEPVKAALGGLEDHPLYAELAADMQVPLIENTFSDILSDNALKADYVHPNAKGYQQVERNLRSALKTLGLLAE